MLIEIKTQIRNMTDVKKKVLSAVFNNNNTIIFGQMAPIKLNYDHSF